MSRLFNGTTDSAATAAAVDLSAVNTLALSAWFWVVAYNATFDLALEHGNPFWSTNGFSFVPRDTTEANNLIAGVGGAGGGPYCRVGSGAPSTGVWHHAVINYDRPNAATNPINAAYLDGVSQALTPLGTGSAVSGNFSATNLLYFGARGGTSNFSNCKLAEACLFPGVFLTADEAKALAAGCHPLRVRPGLAGKRYFPLHGLLSPEPEYVAAGTTVSLTGTARDNHPPVEPFSRRFWRAAPTAPTPYAPVFLLKA